MDTAAGSEPDRGTGRCGRGEEWVWDGDEDEWMTGRGWHLLVLQMAAASPVLTLPPLSFL